LGAHMMGARPKKKPRRTRDLITVQAGAKVEPLDFPNIERIKGPGKNSKTSVVARSVSLYDGRAYLGIILEHSARDHEAKTVTGATLGHFPSHSAAATALGDSIAPLTVAQGSPKPKRPS
jgi:hypothetical protein